MTIYDIAAELHVSPATVSLALNGNSRVAEKTRLRVIEFAKCKGFTRNEQARNFRLRRTRNVAIVVHNIDNDFWNGVVRAVENGLVGVGLSMAAGGLAAALVGANLPRRGRQRTTQQRKSTRHHK